MKKIFKKSKALIASFIICYIFCSFSLLSQTGSVGILNADTANLIEFETGWASPNGSEENSGTMASPWSLDYAVANSDNVFLLPGTYYNESIAITRPNQKIVSLSKWAAVIVGEIGQHCIRTTSKTVNGITINGLKLLRPSLDGIHLESGSNIIQNCWILLSGNAGTGGSGINAGFNTNNLIEYNLIEYSGSTSGEDCGIILSGTNNTIRGNVIRHNYAYGIWLHPENAGEVSQNNFIYNNLLYGNSVDGSGRTLSVWTSDSEVSNLVLTNYVLANTILGKINLDPETVICNGGYLMLTNNIILGKANANQNCLYVYNGGVAIAGWNMTTNSLTGISGVINGEYNKIGYPTFSRPSYGSFWLQSGSAAENCALEIELPVDFFGL